MSNYYYHLCEICCTIAKDKSQDAITRCQAILRMAKDFYPKAELMRITGDYPKFVREDVHLHDYLPHKEIMQIKTVEAIKKGSSDNQDCIELLANSYIKKIEGKVNPNFKEEFMKKSEEYGFSAIIEKKQNNLNPKNYEFLSSSTETTSRSSELSAMLEDKGSSTQQETTKRTKVYEKVSQSTSTSSSTEGNINVISIVITIVIAALTLIYLLTIK